MMMIFCMIVFRAILCPLLCICFTLSSMRTFTFIIVIWWCVLDQAFSDYDHNVIVNLLLFVIICVLYGIILCAVLCWYSYCYDFDHASYGDHMRSVMNSTMPLVMLICFLFCVWFCRLPDYAFQNAFYHFLRMIMLMFCLWCLVLCLLS